MASKSTRRDFVKTAGAVTAATAFPAPAIRKVKAAGDQVLFGVIGTGGRGSYLLKHLTGVDNGRCIAVCDLDDTALKNGVAAAKTNPKTYKDYRELLSRKDIEAVVIATPLYMHFPITKDALLAGKHVFCEKSLVFRPEEVHALRALSNERSKQVLQVGLQRRYSQFYQAAKQMADKGMIGQVTHVQAQWHRNPGWKMKPGPREKNWRLFREFSGGLTAELASHQIDVADWMFGAHPEYVVGVGGQEFIKDGRDVYDNIQLIYRYPRGQKLVYTSISTSTHLPLFGGSRTEFGERVMGTGGTIEITVGTDNEPAVGLWYYEAKPAEVTPASQAKKEAVVAGATLAGTGRGMRPLPILLSKDQFRGNESFLEKEMKYARRWLYSKGVMLPEEERNPVDVQMESFFDCVRSGGRPKANLEVGLADSTAVMLSNLAMDEGRRVYFNEIEKMGRGQAEKA
jgi:predicted dehydrogenase